MAIIDQFQEIETLCLSQRFETKVIKDEQVGFSESGHPFVIRAIAAGYAQVSSKRETRS